MTGLYAAVREVEEVGEVNGFRGSRVQRNIIVAVVLAVVAGFAVSLAIEWLQAYLPSRDSSLRDLICNTFGTFVGAVAAAYLLPKRTAVKSV